MTARTHTIRTKNYRIQVEHYYQQLETYKARSNQSAFYLTFVRIMPELRKYINTRLQELIHQGHFPHNFYEEDDFVDDLFISVYENFDTIKSEEDFYMYLFNEMDNLLKTVERTESNLHQPLEDIEIYAKAERDQLREKITAQLDGDLILKQELDDISYASKGSDFKTVFEVESEKAVVDRLDSEFTHSLTSSQVDKMIANLPLFSRNIARLYIHFHLTLPEIVTITKEPREKVQKSLDAIKRVLQTSLFNI